MSSSSLGRVAGKPFLLKIFLSNNYVHSQIVRMADGHIVAAASTIEQDMRESIQGSKKTIPCCQKVGERLAQRAADAGVPEVHWHRQHGEKYHGRRAALLDALRAGGVKLA